MSGAFVVHELTAPGRGAIRVLELRGEGALARLRGLAPGTPFEAGAFRVVALRDRGGALLDEAVALVESDRRVELHLHGSPAVVERVRAELGAFESPAPARTLEQRAEQRLPHAPSEAAARMLLDQARGALRAEFEALLGTAGEECLSRARDLARRGRVARWLLTPPRVVLAGPTNAGKSTLFNLLVGRERALVHAAAGTTRDALQERVRLGAYALDLLDTAGERPLSGASAEAELELAGQGLAAELRRTADLVLVLQPPGGELPPPTERVRGLRSRADQGPADGEPGPALSALYRPHEARTRVEQVVLEALALPRAPWVPGQGVPFEAEWTEALGSEDASALAARVRSWLAD